MRLLLPAPPGRRQGARRASGWRPGSACGTSPPTTRCGPKRAGTPAGKEIAAYQQRGDLIPDQITADVTRHWLAVFAETTRPLNRYHENRGIQVTVNADIEGPLSL